MLDKIPCKTFLGGNVSVFREIFLIKRQNENTKLMGNIELHSNMTDSVSTFKTLYISKYKKVVTYTPFNVHN